MACFDIMIRVVIRLRKVAHCVGSLYLSMWCLRGAISLSSASGLPAADQLWRPCTFLRLLFIDGSVVIGSLDSSAHFPNGRFETYTYNDVERAE